VKKLLLTTTKDQEVKLSMRPNAGHVLCLFYDRAYLCEGQLHSHFVIGFCISYSLSFYELSLWKEKK